MKELEGVAPALGEERPEKNGAARENDARGAFRKNRQPEKNPEQDQCEPRCSGKDGRVLVSRQAQHDCGAHHRDREHRAEGHVRGGGVRKADHSDSGRQEKEQPARGFCSIEAKREPGQRESSEQGANGAGQSRRRLAHTEQFEAQRRAPIEERRLLEPRLSIEMRRNPIARFHHVPRDPRVTRFVRSNKSDRAKVAEIANIERCENQNGPADAGGKIVSGGIVGGPRSRFHGFESSMERLVDCRANYWVSRVPLASWYARSTAIARK